MINHKDLGESRLASQFKEAVNLINFIRTLLNGSDELEIVFDDLINKRAIDTAEGEQLDNIGEIVGQPRVAILAEDVLYFGFTGFPNAQSFGDDGDPGVGGRFRSQVEAETGDTLIADPEYRTLLRARIIKNTTNTSPEEIISQIQFILGDIEVYILEIGDETKYKLGFGRPLTGNERILVTDADIIPKPLGVDVQYLEYEAGAVFAFQGVQGAADFNTGKLAEGF